MSVKKLAVIVAVVLSFACAKTQQPAAAAKATETATTTAAASAAAPAASSPNQLAGKVAETFNGGGYTYLRIGEEWAAVPEAKVAIGDVVTVDVQMALEKFESKTLNRTFDRIIFGNIASPAKAAMTAAANAPAMPPQQQGERKFPPAMMSAIAQTASQHMQTPAAGAVKIEPPTGGKTVEQLWSEKSSLGGKEVVVRGKVVKSLAGIMGTNWLHLQDGTGSRENGNNDITVTTDATVAVGDVVTVKGILSVEKDFGAGYKYGAIVEKAVVTK